MTYLGELGLENITRLLDCEIESSSSGRDGSAISGSDHEGVDLLRGEELLVVTAVLVCAKVSDPDFRS